MLLFVLVDRPGPSKLLDGHLDGRPCPGGGPSGESVVVAFVGLLCTKFNEYTRETFPILQLYLI